MTTHLRKSYLEMDLSRILATSSPPAVTQTPRTPTPPNLELPPPVLPTTPQRSQADSSAEDRLRALYVTPPAQIVGHKRIHSIDNGTSDEKVKHLRPTLNTPPTIRTMRDKFMHSNLGRSELATGSGSSNALPSASASSSSSMRMAPPVVTESANTARQHTRGAEAETESKVYAALKYDDDVPPYVRDFGSAVIQGLGPTFAKHGDITIKLDDDLDCSGESTYVHDQHHGVKANITLNLKKMREDSKSENEFLGKVVLTLIHEPELHVRRDLPALMNGDETESESAQHRFIAEPGNHGNPYLNAIRRTLPLLPEALRKARPHIRDEEINEVKRALLKAYVGEIDDHMPLHADKETEDWQEELEAAADNPDHAVWATIPADVTSSPTPK